MIMAICCLSLIGIPLTVGFMGKVLLARPALEVSYIGLVIIMVLNAAVSAGYYLRIISAMFLKEPPPDTGLEASSETHAVAVGTVCAPSHMRTAPLMFAGVLSAGACICLGSLVPAMTAVRSAARESFYIQPSTPGIVKPMPPQRSAPSAIPRR